MDPFDRVKLKSFIAPDGSNRDYAQECFRKIVSQLLDKLCTSEKRPLLPQNLGYQFGQDIILEEPQRLDKILGKISELIDNSMNPYHPKYAGHMDSMPTLFSILGEMLASALNNNLFSLEMSPFLTQLEYKLVKEFCALFGLPENSGGVILSGGSLTNLQALVVARNFCLKNNNGAIGKTQFVIFCSEHAHVSIQKAAMVMGIGADHVTKISADANGHLDVDDLRVKIKRAVHNRWKPMAIVATAGTTVTGNIDPIDQIAKVAMEFNIWLHVDAIWGGGLIFSSHKRGLLRGIELANSITFNPQKWMAVAKTCSLLMFRDNSYLEDYFRIRKTYVKEHNIVTDLSETGISGTKRGDVLKLWLSIESMGMTGYRYYIDHTLSLTSFFVEKVKRKSYLKLATEPETAVICMRGEPDHLEPKLFDKWNEGLQDFLLKRRNTFFSLPKYKGENWQRVILLNPFLTRNHIDEIFTAIDGYHSIKK